MIEITEILLKYWIDLVHEELLEYPSDNLVILYESLTGILNKYRGIEKDGRTKKN